ncbi:MAG: YggT family protein [Clostridia bacterium]|nr:YggT family protein [Clostridia bacterium]
MDIKIAILSSLSLFLNLITWIILIRCILNCINIKEDNVIYKIIYTITEPLLKPFRLLLFKSKLMRTMRFDFSPVIVVLIISIIDSFIKF